MSDSFPLTVTIPAEEWATTVRRLHYVEAALVQAYRNQRQLREWFAAGELAAMGLPGLPSTRQGVIRRAYAENWTCRPTPGPGGEHFEFHFSNLPRRAFDEMIRRIIAPTPLAGEMAAPSPAPAVPSPPPQPPSPKAGNAAPPWMLPLMRLVRNTPAVDVDTAIDLLAATWPEDAPFPTRAEVADIIFRHGRTGG